MQNEEFTLEWAVNFIANRIRILREEKGVSAQTMSLELGQNVSYINKIENKTAKPSIEGLYNICEYLGVNFDEFFDFDAKHPEKVKELLENTKNLETDSLQLLIDVAKKMNK